MTCPGCLAKMAVRGPERRVPPHLGLSRAALARATGAGDVTPQARQDLGCEGGPVAETKNPQPGSQFCDRLYDAGSVPLWVTRASDGGR